VVRDVAGRASCAAAAGMGGDRRRRGGEGRRERQGWGGGGAWLGSDSFRPWQDPRRFKWSLTAAGRVWWAVRGSGILRLPISEGAPHVWAPALALGYTVRSE
jgi:hypothetical protein